MVARYFRAADSVTLDAGGGGTVELAPPGVEWRITLTTVTVSTSLKQPEFDLFIGGTSELDRAEGTYSGARDSSDTPHTVQVGQSVYGVWTGGDAGAKATLRLAGFSYPAGQSPTS